MVVVSLTMCAGAACGKKGPPLAPLVPIPAAVDTLDAKRVGGDVYVSLKVPTANVDAFIPADLSRIDVYAYTGRSAPPRARWFELATVVASVSVAPAPKPGEAPETVPPSTGPKELPLQGATITVRDTLTPDELVQGLEAQVTDSTLRPAASGDRTAASGERTADTAQRPAAILPLRRFYTALPINSRGRPGPPGLVAEFPLIPVPDPPPSIALSYNERTVFVTWEPSGGLLGFLLERAVADEPPPFVTDEDLQPSEPSEPPRPLGYNVYREIVPDTMDPPAAPTDLPWREEAPEPLAAVATAALDFTDTLEFGRRRCYTVRAARGTGPAAQIGNASPEVCVTPTDVFPPAPPLALAAVASEGTISLIWEPNGELDLGGYVVLRGEAPSDTLQPLTTAPVVAASYRDETVRPGVRYVYAVVAVDNRFPVPNLSLESTRVEETAR